MVLLKLLIFTLTFNEHIVDLDATICPKGQRITKSNGCEACPNGYFQPEQNDSQKCKVCTKCDTEYGITVKECTAKADRKCQCREGFVPWVNDPASCNCPSGFGLTVTKNCLKCENGYFSKRINSPCQKWKECKSGVKSNGTDTSDVICNEVTSNIDTMTPHTSNTITTLKTYLRFQSTQVESQTQKINQRTTTTTTTTTTAAPRHTATTRNKHPLNTDNHIGITLLLLGIVGLLVLTAVTCKFHITLCVQRKPAVPTNDLFCRRPVEESGDDSQSSLKLNPKSVN